MSNEPKVNWALRRAAVEAQSRQLEVMLPAVIQSLEHPEVARKHASELLTTLAEQHRRLANLYVECEEERARLADEEQPPNTERNTDPEWQKIR